MTQAMESMGGLWRVVLASACCSSCLPFKGAKNLFEVHKKNTIIAPEKCSLICIIIADSTLF